MSDFETLKSLIFRGAEPPHPTPPHPQYTFLESRLSKIVSVSVMKAMQHLPAGWAAVSESSSVSEEGCLGLQQEMGKQDSWVS